MSKLKYCARFTLDGVRKLSALSSYIGQQRQNSQSSFLSLREYGGFSRNTCPRRNLGDQSRFYGSEAKSVERRPSFSEVNSKDVSYFQSILGENNVILDADRLQSANTDWMHKYKGFSNIMLLPRSTEETLCGEGRFLDTFHLLDDVEKKGFVVMIDSDIYFVLLVELCKGRNVSEVVKLSILMIEKKIQVKDCYVKDIEKYISGMGEMQSLAQLCEMKGEWVRSAT